MEGRRLVSLKVFILESKNWFSQHSKKERTRLQEIHTVNSVFPSLSTEGNSRKQLPPPGVDVSGLNLTSTLTSGGWNYGRKTTKLPEVKAQKAVNKKILPAREYRIQKQNKFISIFKNLAIILDR